MTEETTVSKKRWYVLQAFSGFESRVVAGKRRKSERKFFPGYVLVEMEMNDDTWHLVKSVPRVMGFIGGTPDKPAPISKREADAILNRLEQSSDKPRHRNEYHPGEEVRVTEGPFADFNGTVEEVDYEKGRLKVSDKTNIKLILFSYRVNNR